MTRTARRSGSGHEKVSRSANGSPSSRCSEMGISRSARTTEVMEKARCARGSTAQSAVRQGTFLTGLRFMTPKHALAGQEPHVAQRCAAVCLLERLESAERATGLDHPIERLLQFSVTSARQDAGRQYANRC